MMPVFEKGTLVCYLDENVVVLHQQGVVVDLAQELGCHHFVRAVLDETRDVEETCRETQEKRKQSGKQDY